MPYLSSLTPVIASGVIALIGVTCIFLAWGYHQLASDIRSARWATVRQEVLDEAGRHGQQARFGWLMDRLEDDAKAWKRVVQRRAWFLMAIGATVAAVGLLALGDGLGGPSGGSRGPGGASAGGTTMVPSGGKITYQVLPVDPKRPRQTRLGITIDAPTAPPAKR